MSRREYLEMQKDRNCKVEEKQIRDSTKEQKEANFLKQLLQIVPLGNPDYPKTREYLQRKAELEKGFFKTEYRLYTSKNSFLVLNQTEYLYYLELGE